MSVASPAPPVVTLSPRRASGGAPARRAVVRWAWRLFRREWRQQLLILLLVVGAVAAVVVGSAVAADSPPPAAAGFGTATDLAVFDLGGGVDASNQARAAADAQIRDWERRFGTVQVIENETRLVPGSTQTYQIRSQDPRGAFGGPMLQLVSGHYPTGPGEVALTPGLASDLQLAVGDHWTAGGVRRTVVGIVQNPQNLLDQFALVPPGQVAHPTSVEALFDARGVDARSLGPNVTTAGRAANDNPINPTTIVLALATVGMLLIALVSIGGFTVLAQRRMRSLGMLQSIGATSGNVRLVLEANGVVVGALGAVLGFALGLALWLAYRPHLEQSAHHLIPGLGLPWNVVAPAMVLAVLATFFAARYPARAVTRVPVVVALAGRPAPPRRIHRSLVPGLVALGAAFAFFSLSGSSQGNGGIVWVVPGFVAAVVGIILVAPFFLSFLARLGQRAPVAVRLPLREMARYRARSGSALSAISVGVLIAVVVCGVAAARYANVFDYVGPNLASNQLAVWSPSGPSAPPSAGAGPGGGAVSSTTPLPAERAAVRSIAAAVGATATVELDNPAASLQNPVDTGRQWNGAIFVATPALLRAYGIDPLSIPSSVDVLSSRPGLAGSGVQLVGGGNAFGGKGGPPPGPGATNPCPQGSCLIQPVVREEPALPTGTSAPNTVITESALRRLHVAGQSSLDGWILETRSPLTASQIRSADALAAAVGLSAESKNSAPTSAEIVDWATVFAVALALGILAMSVGLLRSETAGDLRTLTAVGASSRIRRSMTAVTAGGLALLGALLGTVAAYVALVAWFRGNSLEGGLSDLTDHVPWTNLTLLVVAMPVAAAGIGWVLAGREPVGTATRPLE